MVEAARGRLAEEHRRRVQIIDLEKLVRHDASAAAAPTKPGERS